MTAKEKKVLATWNRKMSAQLDTRNELFIEMQKLYEKRGGGEATCCLEVNLEYLLSSNDEQTRRRALSIYADYKAADAQFKAMGELMQALANLR